MKEAYVNPKTLSDKHVDMQIQKFDDKFMALGGAQKNWISDFAEKLSEIGFKKPVFF